MPSAGAYKYRFGTVSRAYELVGYQGFWTPKWLEKLRGTRRLRSELMNQIVTQHATEVFIDDPGGKQHTRLRLQDGSLISVIASRPFRIYKGAVRWLIKPSKAECHFISLVGRLNEEGDAFRDIFVTPPVEKSTGFKISEFDPWLEYAIRLTDIQHFPNAVEKMKQRLAAYVPSATHPKGRPTVR